MDRIDIKQIGEWKLAQKILKTGAQDLDKAIEQAVEQEAEFFVTKIKQYMRTGKFEALSANTLAVTGGGGGRDKGGRFKKGAGGRHGGKPLFRSGDLRNAVTKVMMGGAAFIGVPRNAPKKGSTGLVNIADVHEHGRTIVMKMTPKMRRFLHARLPKRIGPRMRNGSFSSGQSTGILVIRIPPRPFIAPVFAEHGPGSQERFTKRLAKALGGQFGDG
jgi:hypothetical protein